MMKRLALVCCVLISGCAENSETDYSYDKWSVLWQLGEEEIEGDLVFFKDHHAQLKVYGQPHSLLVKEPTNINFYWRANNNELTLKRLDNNIELKYRIVKKTPRYMELAFADDIMVKLYRN
ncbi:hypothetical protein [Fulvivirga imtechensis]|uniref:hypothetical protein n=1 Tax=Fulvivirga imtechensis TaxID=881893 RepID=UPI0012FB6674|nr:hypothetical protein [Fulvivirga imtechensis]